ncbi:MAG: alpha/beta hydrolase-fold protein [Saprospiraceae bacterium]
MSLLEKPLGSLSALVRPKTPGQKKRTFHSHHLNRELTLRVFLPPDYALRSGKRYPLLLLNDGQDLERMEFASVLEQLYRKNEIPFLIVVGIDANEERIREYGTAREADYKGRGNKAPAFRNFIMLELLPWLYKQYRINGTTSETAYAGFSLGGLSALDTAWAFPELFGVAGVFSGALWWRWSPVDPANPDADRIMHDIVEQATDRPNNQRFWFQTGTNDEDSDRNNNGVIDSIDDTLHLLDAMRKQGYSEEQLAYYEMEGGEHNPRTWGKAMPHFLKWAFGKKAD